MMADTQKVTEPTITWSDYKYLQERIRHAEEKIRLLIRILVDKKIIGEELAKSFTESKVANPKILEWYETKKWIQGAVKHEGALRGQLGIKEDETIPKSILQQIVDTETGKTVTFRGKTITVTTQLKRRALLALRLSKMPKRHD